MIYRFDIEVQNLLHKCWQLREQCFVAVVLSHMRDQYSPKCAGSSNFFPRNVLFLQVQEKKKKQNINI